MKHVVSVVALGCVLLGMSTLPSIADDDVAALVVDNGSGISVPEPSSWAVFAVGLAGVAVLGLWRRKTSRRELGDDRT